ncbi:MAG: DUF3006 domain-containing protein [Thermoflexales bacterium]|nr:DUF3006 domain-containing protein [Thermoflexales bacterium]
MPDSTDFVEGPAPRRGVIDQFEGDLAVIVFEDDEQLVVPRSTLPPDARPGDVVRISPPPAPEIATGAAAADAEPEPPAIEVDAEDTVNSRQRIRNLLDDIFK